MPGELSNTIPPYVTWGVFKSTTDTLAETTVPSGPMDRRVLHWLSGADHGALMSALRFLGLADSQNRATNQYCELIEEVKSPLGLDKFRDKLMAILDDKYKPILARIDLERGTISELEKAFREEMSVAQGQMMTKTIRFFIKAYTEAGLTVLSPHITKPKPKAPRSIAPKNGTKKVRSMRTRDTQHDELKPPVIPSGFQRMPIPGVGNGFIQYPTDLSVTDCDMFNAAVTMLRAYATARTGGKEKKP